MSKHLVTQACDFWALEFTRQALHATHATQFAACMEQARDFAARAMGARLGNAQAAPADDEIAACISRAFPNATVAQIEAAIAECNLDLAAARIPYTLHYSGALLADGERSSDELDSGRDLVALRATRDACFAEPSLYGLAPRPSLWVTNDETGEEVL